MNTYLLGGNGRLGNAIANRYADTELMSLPRSEYSTWANVGAVDKIARYFERHAGNATVFVAAGLLDPNLPPEDLLSVNYLLPRHLIEGAARQGIKIVTFGTVMEGLLASSNHYVASKKRLSDYVREIACTNVPVLHLQIHTLYGVGQPSPSMFLGQMLASLRNNEPFRMTSGQQLREYHHFDDDAHAIRQIAESTAIGISDLSHGKPTSLCAIAKAVFSATGKNHLLEIGSLPDPVSENYGKIFERSSGLEGVRFRDAILGTAEYMKRCCSSLDIRSGRGSCHDR